MERARVNEQLGYEPKAIRDYAYVADAWRFADPVLQPMVQEAKTALARLGGEQAR